MAQRVLAGEQAAWDEFVLRYAGLLFAVIRRELRTTDRDEVRSALVDVLVAVRRSKLRGYEGRAALSTWLAVVTRTEAIDILRRQAGRRRDRRLLASLDPTRRLILRMFHYERRSLNQILSVLNAADGAWTMDELLITLDDLERQLGQSWFRRLAYDLRAHALGAGTGRMLEYADHVRQELQLEAATTSPESRLIERETRLRLDRLREKISRLDPRERELLDLRFSERRSAAEIASELGFESPRSVYRAMDRIVRKLRRWMGGRTAGPA